MSEQMVEIIAFAAKPHVYDCATQDDGTDCAHDIITALQRAGYVIVRQEDIDNLNKLVLDFLAEQVARADALGIAVKPDHRAMLTAAKGVGG